MASFYLLHTRWWEFAAGCILATLKNQGESETNNKDGKYEGKVTLWYEDGEKNVEAFFKNDKCVSGC